MSPPKFISMLGIVLMCSFSLDYEGNVQFYVKEFETATIMVTLRVAPQVEWAASITFLDSRETLITQSCPTLSDLEQVFLLALGDNLERFKRLK